VARILLIDDEESFGKAVEKWLCQQQHTVCRTTMPVEGLEIATTEPFDLLLIDNIMPRMSGLDFLKQLLERGIDLPVILMTSVPNDRIVIEAMKNGAFAYVIKPGDRSEFEAAFATDLRNALARTRRPAPVRLTQSSEVVDESVIEWKSSKMTAVLSAVGKLANVNVPVLILGETGTGKDLVARALHTHSRRQNKPFVAINCANFLNKELVASEFLGYEPHTFTGAERLRKGFFEHATGGTLFLDELAEMPLHMQGLLLRVLENHEVTRVGGRDAIRVDVRIIAATCRDLKARVAAGQFREDLYYRLDKGCIHVPPLRERKEDIEPLARLFLRRMFGTELTPELLPETLHRLREFSWPGNVRELQNVLGKAALNSRYQQIHPEDLDFGELDSPATPSLPNRAQRVHQVTVGDPSESSTSREAALAGLRAAIAWAWETTDTKVMRFLEEQLEREVLLFAQSHSRESRVQLANRLGMSRTTILKLQKQFGIEGVTSRDTL